MRNFIQHGDSVEVTAPKDGSSGDVVQVNDLVGVAADHFTSGGHVVVKLGGVFDVPKKNGTAIALGSAVYWNNAAGQMEGAASTAWKYAGIAVEAASAAAATVRALFGYVKK